MSEDHPQLTTVSADIQPNIQPDPTQSNQSLPQNHQQEVQFDPQGADMVAQVMRRSVRVKRNSYKSLQMSQRQSFDLANKFNTTYTSQLMGFVSDKQSANTFRNSLVPIAFPKESRFKEFKQAAAVAPYYKLRDVFETADAQFKKGFGFGFTERKVFDASKQAYKPAPDNYYNAKTFSEFVENKLDNKCTFGEPWGRMKRRCDILDRRIMDIKTIDTLSPANYNPRPENVKRFYGAFSLRPRFKMAEEHQAEKRPGPGPQVYTIEDKLVKQTRFTHLLLGGHAAKDGLVIDKNPGPGSYDLPDSIAAKSLKKSKYSKASLLNMNNSYQSQSASLISSPRECAFSVPLMGDPFNPVGFIKQPASSYGRRDPAMLGQPAGDTSYSHKFIPNTARESIRGGN